MRRDAAERQETMKRLFLRLACLAFVVAIALSCDSTHSNPVDPGLSGAIQGTISMGDSPLFGIQVSLEGPAGNRTASTGANGSFTFADLPPGAYTVTANVAEATCNSASAAVQAGQTAQVNIDCEQAGGLIIGTVLVGGTPPQQSASVSLTGPAGNRTASTGANGNFTFTDLPPGAYTVKASLQDTPLLTFTCDSITVTVQALQTAGATVSCIGNLVPVGTIRGQVTINGEARPIVFVELWHLAENFLWAFRTTIPDGRWEVSAPRGDYRVVIKSPPGLTCDATEKLVTVLEDQAAVVNFACTGDVKGAIQGFTTHEFGSHAAAPVTLTGAVNRETTSNADGFFAFEDLPPGDYLVNACLHPNPKSVAVREGVTAFVHLDCS
jgi:uncharacterized protein (DUF2141 family)